MTEIKITLPNPLASEAREAGLLTPRAIQSLLRATMLRRAATRNFLANAERVAAAGVRPMSENEIQAEVVAARKARRRDRAARRR